MAKLVINFGHMLGDRSVRFLQEKLGAFEYVHERLKIDFDKPLPDQVVKAVNAAESRCKGPLESYGGGTGIYVVPPGLTDPALLLQIEIFGRTGAYPHMLLMRRDDGEFVVYDIADGEKAKLQARGRRKPQTLGEPHQVSAPDPETWLCKDCNRAWASDVMLCSICGKRKPQTLGVQSLEVQKKKLPFAPP